LVMHSFKDAMRLSEKANPIAISLDKDVELALALNDRLLLSSSQYSGLYYICFPCTLSLSVGPHSA